MRTTTTGEAKEYKREAEAGAMREYKQLKDWEGRYKGNGHIDEPCEVQPHSWGWTAANAEHDEEASTWICAHHAYLHQAT
jgi:hypothetical protein